MCIKLLLFAIIVFGSTVANFGAESRKPNIVVFLVDDLGATDIACFGSSFYETPNVDRLAREGMRFTAAYSTCPVCSPTRSSMMTGRYPQRTGITDYINTGRTNQPESWARNTKLLPAPYEDHLALEERTIAEELHDAGYATFFAGKWHLGGKDFLPTAQGFDINKGGTNAGSPRSYSSPYSNPQLKDGPAGEKLEMRLADETCQFIEANRERPFFAYLSFYSVHIPLQAPEELIAKYKRKAEKSPKAKWGRERESKVRLVQNHPTYAGMIEMMDRAVGKVLERLDQLKLAEDTIVIFTADNGGVATSEGWPTSNLPLRAGKGWMYEGGIRVPTVVRWPGVVKAASTCATPVISVDYFPTLLEAAGRPVESGHVVDGKSIMPLLRGVTMPQRAIYWDYPHYGNQGGSPASAVREGRWKLIEWREDDSTELYNLEADPGEEHNLAENRAYVVERLRGMLAKWRRDVGAKAPTKNPRYSATP